MEQEIKANDAGCPSCGANMKYLPETQKLYCENCKTSKDIIFEKMGEKRAWNLRDKATKSTKDWAKSTKNLKCPNCGASVVLSNLEYAKNCPYCETALVGNDASLNSLEPDGIIPFKFSDAVASEKYKKGLKKKFFAPRAFKKAPPTESIKGIYIPSFIFDADTNSTYKGKLADDDSYTDRNGHRRTKTSYKHISGTHASKQYDIVVESSSKISQAQMTDILPYNTQEIVKFKQDFIMGYTIEQYESTVDECKVIAKRIMEENIKREILSKYSYDRVCYFEMTTDYANEKYNYNLFPVYKCDYKYKNKTYTTIMNGQTGKVGGGYPISGLKVFLVVMTVLGLIGGIIALVMALQ